MKRVLNIFFVTFLLFLASCGLRGERKAIPVNAEYFITPGRDVLSVETRFSELLDEYRYIIPESTGESIFAFIYKAYIYNGSIYLFDKKFQDKILVFDINNGKFLMGIGLQGRGPNEYIRLGNFTIDKSNGNILILDEMNNKVLIYDAGSGNYKSSFNLDFVARNIEYVDENTLAFAGGGHNMDRLHLTDMNGTRIGSYIASNDKNWVVPINSFSKGTGNEVIFKTYLNDSLYTITPEGPVVSRYVDFGNDALSWVKFSSYTKNERDNIEEHIWKYRTDMKYYT